MNLAPQAEQMPYDVDGFTDLRVEVAARNRIPIDFKFVK